MSIYIYIFIRTLCNYITNNLSIISIWINSTVLVRFVRKYLPQTINGTSWLDGISFKSWLFSQIGGGLAGYRLPSDLLKWKIAEPQPETADHRIFYSILIRFKPFDRVIAYYGKRKFAPNSVQSLRKRKIY